VIKPRLGVRINTATLQYSITPVNPLKSECGQKRDARISQPEAPYNSLTPVQPLVMCGVPTTEKNRPGPHRLNSPLGMPKSARPDCFDTTASYCPRRCSPTLMKHSREDTAVKPACPKTAWAGRQIWVNRRGFPSQGNAGCFWTVPYLSVKGHPAAALPCIMLLLEAENVKPLVRFAFAKPVPLLRGLSRRPFSV